jgi:glutathione S-transferase
MPAALALARVSSADDGHVRRDLADLPTLLDRVDALIAEGTIGGEQPNAADFQLGTAVRVLLAYTDLRHLVEGRPAAELALRVLPEYPKIPPFLPREWVPEGPSTVT